MSFNSISALIEELVKPIFDQQGIDLIELKIKRKGKVLAIEIYADKASGGITLDECVFLNRSVVNKIEAEEIIEDEYVVEVSSPGADRPIRTEKDFLRVIGKNVRFYLKEEVEGKLEISGLIKGVERDKVFIIDQLGKLIVVITDQIQKAIQII